ncbi:MAG: hypothetical protein EOP45_01850 [Sphingobacteriaceae bacterium]|nr:MAG: hypothetical protein EOP45_01850 [Sphingobacteriaceae bacterium]
MKKANRTMTIIWVVIILSVLGSVKDLFKGISHFASNPVLFWMTITKLGTVLILVLMALQLKKIVFAYTQNKQWQFSDYKKLKGLGYLSLVLPVLNAIFQITYEKMWISYSANPVPDPGFLYVFRRFYIIVLMESPVLWVFALSIFLFASLLQAAHQVKAENESFI